MRKVFVSYSHKDREAREFAHFLYNRLPDLGAEPLYLIDEFEVGTNWQIGITEQINKCSIFICFIDRDNPNIMFELGYALAKNKKIIIVGDFKDLPADLRSMTYVPKESHPYELLMHVEKYLSSESGRISPYDVDLTDPRRTIELLLERPELLDSLDPREFEQLVSRWFSMRGYVVEKTVTSRDYGYDFLVRPFREERAVVEVKKYKSTSQVPLAVIRQLVGSMAMERIPYGIVVSTAPFTKSVSFFLQDLKPTIYLWTLEDLVRMGELSNERLESDTRTHVSNSR